MRSMLQGFLSEQLFSFIRLTSCGFPLALHRHGLFIEAASQSIPARHGSFLAFVAFRLHFTLDPASPSSLMQ